LKLSRQHSEGNNPKQQQQENQFELLNTVAHHQAEASRLGSFFSVLRPVYVVIKSAVRVPS
jgi:hypothetical protein